MVPQSNRREGAVKPGKSMQEVSEWGELKTFFDRRLIKAIGHPVREHILAVLNERIASAREIGDELGADVSSFYHHIEELEKLECIERVATKQRRGANEHFFGPGARSSSMRRVAALRRPRQGRCCGELVQYRSMTSSVHGGGHLDAQDDRHVSWTPAEFDPRGWEEART